LHFFDPESGLTLLPERQQPATEPQLAPAAS
jgi:hypothetical protein